MQSEIISDVDLPISCRSAVVYSVTVPELLAGKPLISGSEPTSLPTTHGCSSSSPHLIAASIHPDSHPDTPVYLFSFITISIPHHVTPFLCPFHIPSASSRPLYPYRSLCLDILISAVV